LGHETYICGVERLDSSIITITDIVRTVAGRTI
jgi:hypothetical protein